MRGVAQHPASSGAGPVQRTYLSLRAFHLNERLDVVA